MNNKPYTIAFWTGLLMQWLLSTVFLVQRVSTLDSLVLPDGLLSLLFGVTVDAAFINLGVFLPLFMAFYLIVTFPKSEDKPDGNV